MRRTMGRDRGSLPALPDTRALRGQERGVLMRRRSILAVLILTLALALPAAVAADDPPGPAIRHQFRTDGLPVTGTPEIAFFINEYVPGAQTAPHTHPGMVVGTMIEGENTCVCGDKTKTYKLGESLIELPNELAVFKNTGATRARVMASIVLPKGAGLSTPQPNPSPAPPAPTAAYLFRTDAILPAGAYEVAHTVLDFAPGAQTPLHTHPGQVVVTVLDGELTFTTGGATKVYKVGESFVELPGVVGQARNVGNAPASVMAVYLLPKGAPFSAPVAMPGLPNTGAGGGTRPLSLGWLAFLAGGCPLVLGWHLRRKPRTT